MDFAEISYHLTYQALGQLAVGLQDRFPNTALTHCQVEQERLLPPDFLGKQRLTRSTER